MTIVADDAGVGIFNGRPCVGYAAFEALRDNREFLKVVNGGYFVEWACGADLSAATIDAHLSVVGEGASEAAPETAA